LENAVHGSDSDENAAIEGAFCWKRAVLVFGWQLRNKIKIPFQNWNGIFSQIWNLQSTI
jgi:hypothetical protein